VNNIFTSSIWLIDAHILYPSINDADDDREERNPTSNHASFLISVSGKVLCVEAKV
jgi:hypothetical protein